MSSTQIPFIPPPVIRHPPTFCRHDHSKLSIIRSYYTAQNTIKNPTDTCSHTRRKTTPATTKQNTKANNNLPGPPRPLNPEHKKTNPLRISGLKGLEFRVKTQPPLNSKVRTLKSRVFSRHKPRPSRQASSRPAEGACGWPWARFVA